MPPASSSASFLSRCLSQRSECDQNSLPFLASVRLCIFFHAGFGLPQSADVGGVVWRVGLRAAADAGHLFCRPLPGQCLSVLRYSREVSALVRQLVPSSVFVSRMWGKESQRPFSTHCTRFVRRC